LVNKGWLSLICVLLAACHWEPLYGPQASLEAQLDPAIEDKLALTKIALIPDREGQVLRNHLLDKLNPAGEPSAPQWQLVVSLSLQKSGGALRKDGTFQRFNLVATAPIKLIDLQTNKTLYDDTARAVMSYAIGDSTAEFGYSATVAEQDAQLQAVKLLADEIYLMLATHYKKWPGLHEAANHPPAAQK
jgi:LPS-assembly lipoprotein